MFGMCTILAARHCEGLHEVGKHVGILCLLFAAMTKGVRLNLASIFPLPCGGGRGWVIASEAKQSTVYERLTRLLAALALLARNDTMSF